LWKGDPPFVIDSVLNAGCIGIGNDGSAEVVIPSVHSINSFPIFYGIIEKEPIDFIVSLVDGVGLVEGNVEGKVVVRWVSSSDGQH
jgi:hypothetical protein